jgi:predicted CXXCH cytochrome family protein
MFEKRKPEYNNGMSQRPAPAKKRIVYRTKKQAPKQRLVLPIPLLIGLVSLFLIAAAGTGYSINLENHDSFCASCHSQPETKFVDQAKAASPETLAAFHSGKQTRCIDCHSGAGPLGRAVGLMQGGQDLVSYVSGKYHNPAIVTNPIDDGSCLKCHQAVTTGQSFDNHFHVFLSRWQSVDANAGRCVDCHNSHTSGKPDQGYMSQPVVEAVCQRCHQTLGGGE